MNPSPTALRLPDSFSWGEGGEGGRVGRAIVGIDDDPTHSD